MKNELYIKLSKNRILTNSEQKVQFLYSFVPKVRLMERKVIEELEIHFVREEYSPGFLVQR